MKKKRLQYIDLARGFAILAIVYSHFTNQVSVVKPDLATSFGICFLSQFHVMLFFIIRGLVLANQGTIGQKGYILKRCKALLVPYVVFSVLNILYLAIDMAGKGSDRIVIEVERNLIHAVTLYGISVLWFLPALLLGEVWLVLIMKKIKQRYVPYLMVVLMTVICVVSPYFSVKETGCIWMSSMQMLILNYILVVLLRSLVALFYIWTGFVTADFFEKLYGNQKRIGTYAFILLGSGCFLFLFSATVELHYLDMGKGWFSILCSLCLSFGFLIAFMLLEKRDLSRLCYPGKDSLWIMCTHKDFGIPGWCVFVAEYTASASPRAKNYIFWFAAAATLFLIEFIICFVIHKSQAFLLLQKQIKYEYVDKTGMINP